MTPNMHYCFLTFGSWEGNAGLIRPRHLGAELCERGNLVSYVVDDVPYNHHLNLHPKAQVVLVPHARSLMQIWTRRRTIHNLKPDFVHLLNAHAKSYLALVGMRGVKIVADWDEPPTVKDLGFLRNRLESFVDRWLRSRSVVRITCTSFLRDHYRDRFRVESVYIPHAPYLSNHDEGVSPFRAPTAVYMGNLYSLWDHDILFDAALILKQRGASPPILIMGDGPEMAKWQAFVADNDLRNVTLAGYVSGQELWLRLRHAHVLLFPIRDTIVNRSRCPSKVFAYAQARRPIITSAVGELPFMLGSQATFIDSTPHAFAEALERVMGQPRPPEVHYPLDQHSWRDRCDRLMKALAAVRAGLA